MIRTKRSPKRMIFKEQKMKGQHKRFGINWFGHCPQGEVGFCSDNWCDDIGYMVLSFLVIVGLTIAIGIGF